MSDYILRYLRKRVQRLGLEPQTPEVRARLNEIRNLALIIGNYSDLSAEWHVAKHARLEETVRLSKTE
jgi:hypothetical protein